MKSNQKVGRLVGALFLFVFVSGIIIFQFLQGPVLFSDNFITTTSENSNKIIVSIVLGVLSGITSIIIATILLPIFKNYNSNLGYLYFAFSILNFVAIMVDNNSVIAMLEFSQQYVKNEAVNSDTIEIMKDLIFEKHWWTHYLFLLISCFPVFVLYYTLYLSRLVPRVISIFGVVAVLLMFTEELFAIFGNSISMNMLYPIGLIQLILPLWLIIKGFQSPILEKANT